MLALFVFFITGFFPLNVSFRFPISLTANTRGKKTALLLADGRPCFLLFFFRFPAVFAFSAFDLPADFPFRVA
jgi:hypothetical protein